MAAFNRVVLVGNLVRDPELRYTSGGTAVTDISLAINERKKSGDTYVDDVMFVDVTLWGRNAEVAAEFAKKGNAVLVEGRLKQDKWQTPEGQNRSKVGVVGERLQLLSPKSSNAENTSPAVETDDSIPI